LLLSENFGRVLDDPTNLEARSGMQLGACFAGLAIENSMLGAAHALANPLTAHYQIAHGQAVALMLPHVIRFNGEKFGCWYEELLENTGGSNGNAAYHGSGGLADLVVSFSEKAKLSTQLRQLQIPREQLSQLATDATKQWTRNFNPRKVEEVEMLALYEQAY
jgi:alcohol dehydrogenase